MNRFTAERLLKEGYQQETLQVLKKHGYTESGHHVHNILVTNKYHETLSVNLFGDIDGLELHEWLDNNPITSWIIIT